MKQLIILVSLTVSLLISTQSFSQSSEKLRSIQKKSDSTAVNSGNSYSCPVHPGVLSDKPGKCPQCGRTLVKKEIRQVIYTCPNHPEIRQDKPGVCPKCGTRLIKKETSPKENLKQKFPKS